MLGLLSWIGRTLDWLRAGSRWMNKDDRSSLVQYHVLSAV